MISVIEAQTRAGERASLLLHSCCAPCSSSVLERIRGDFAVTVFYYNPNITEETEYKRRKDEEIRLIQELNRLGPPEHAIRILEATYDPERYLSAVKGLESAPEGGERCGICFALRLSETARAAAEHGFDYFASTLTLSPLKDAERLNSIGEAAAERYKVRWLPSDFKKRNGYLRSLELSREFGLYRQDYCGCVFSRQERAAEREESYGEP